MIDCTIRIAAELQRGVLLAGAFDGGPPIARIGGAQIGQARVDGVSMDVDEACRDGGDGDASRLLRRSVSSSVGLTVRTCDWFDRI
jgi:hypothetical protein